MVALGSNQRHPRHGASGKVIAAALRALAVEGLNVLAASPVMASRPLGPSRRTYANAAALVTSVLPPPALLAALQRIEAAFGRRRRGQRWAARLLDLDVVLWDGGCWAAPDLIIPHRGYRERRFVLTPLRAIAPRWRDPLTGLTPRQLEARLTRPRPLPKRHTFRDGRAALQTPRGP